MNAPRFKERIRNGPNGYGTDPPGGPLVGEIGRWGGAADVPGGRRRPPGVYFVVAFLMYVSGDFSKVSSHVSEQK